MSLPRNLQQEKLRTNALELERPASVPAHVRMISTPPPHINRPASSHTFRDPGGGAIPDSATSLLDNTPQLLRASPTVVKTRTGSVLSRGAILKSDHYPSGRALDLDLNLHGAPNFRSPTGSSGFNVFGVAQPRLAGLKAILSVLNCRPGQPSPSHCVFFSTREEPLVYIGGRPFVLRDANQPRETIAFSDRAENIEGVEERLKADILAEAANFGGLILTHQEVVEGGGDIIPTWTAVDETSVMTSREVWNNMKQEGWHVEYHRIPISPDQPIEDNYLDAYVSVISSVDPLKTPLVFSCGMGAVRTTFAMIAASLVRRKQFLSLGFTDPYNIDGNKLKLGGTNSPSTVAVGAILIEQVTAQQELSRSLLRLTYILQQNLENEKSQTAIELLLTQPLLLDNLRKAHSGNYGLILSLLGCLDNGLKVKKLVDVVIDSCDHVINLREEILTQRIRYSLTSMDDKQRGIHLLKASKALEKYFFMIAFASYVEDVKNFKETFSDWMKTRFEIWNQVLFLRKSGSRLNVFAPVDDLSLISKSGTKAASRSGAARKKEVELAGGRVLGDEWSDHVVKNRSGIILRASTLLKADTWGRKSLNTPRGIRGVINFRNIPGTNIYALGQPTVDAIDEVIRRIKAESPRFDHVVWITLREEPIVMINGAPYCLRRESFSLRNMKDYGGISASRLETLEERLKDDVIAETHAFGGRTLLHTETADGEVVPIWEEVDEKNVAVLRDIMELKRDHLTYTRIPITSEKPPDFHDISDLMDVVIRTDSATTPIVLNCQLGQGRSTITSIIVLLIQRWLKTGGTSVPNAPAGLRRRFSMVEAERDTSVTPSPQPRRHSYQVINNLLRVVKRGLSVKETVDKAIDTCSEVFNLRDSIEEARIRAEEATDERQKRQETAKGLNNLRKYFELIILQAYLDSIPPDTTMRSFESFETFVRNRPVFKTFENELFTDRNALKPLERVNISDSLALPDEVKQIVANRSGAVLSASTILKSDYFSGLQKLSLPERIEGSPNFRRLPVTLSFGGIQSWRDDKKFVCGSGMPTLSGLRRALSRVDASPEGSNCVWWTSLREEPVLYVKGRPHVLRLIDRPLQNVEATGITTDVVESMEKSLKRDVQKEVRKGGGRILLHDEVEDPPGQYTITPEWETISEDEIMTPRDVFNLMVTEGYKVDYARVAITDEQAPLPEALALILERVETGLEHAGDLIFNCQMGRGRTTTGMIAACLISTVVSGGDQDAIEREADSPPLQYDSIDGPSEEEAYLNGEYKIILKLVGLLSQGKASKLLADRAVDAMSDVQNLRKAIHDCKLKVDATDAAATPSKYKKLLNMGINYLYRYAMLIIFANYLLEVRQGAKGTFPTWLKEHREITNLLAQKSLD